MFDHATSKDNHTALFSPQSRIVERSDVLHEVNDETRLSPRLKVDDVTQSSVCEGGAVHRDLILPAPVVNALLIVDSLPDSIDDLSW